MASAVDLRLFGPRVRDDNRKSPHWACHRHLSRVGCFYCWFVKTGTIYCQCGQGFFLATRESKEFSRLFSRSVGSIPCVASSATTWANLPNVGRQPTRMYQVRQWACNRHFAHGRTLALQYRLKSSTRVTFSSLSGTITGLWWKGRRISSFYQIRQ